MIRDFRTRKKINQPVAFFFLDLQLHDARGMLDHFGDVTRPNFAENMFNDLDNSDEPVSLFVELRTRKKNNKLEQLEKGGGGKLTQKTPDRIGSTWVSRKGDGRSGLPCNCQLMNNTMKKWCEYQNCS